MKLKRITHYFILLMLASCSATEDQQLQNHTKLFKSTPAGKAELYIFRKATPPLAFNAYILVNDSKVASLPINSYTHLILEPGDYSISSKWPLLAAIPKSSLTIKLERNKKYFISAESSVPLTLYGADVMATYGESSSAIQRQADSIGIETVKRLRFVPAK